MTLKSASMNRRAFTIAAGAAAVAAGGVSKATAQEASPAAGDSMGLPPLPEGATVVATGLFNPRFLAFGDDGTLYVTEVGVGGDEPFVFGPPADDSASPVAEPVVEEEATPAADAAPPSTRGYTGQISAIAPDGTQSVAVSGLASYSDGVGTHGICVLDGTVYFTIGGTAVLAGVEPLIGENGVHAFDPATGEVTQVAEFNTYEIENNPDGQDVNPNLYGISVGDSDGRLTVNDAGGNTVYSLDPATGAFQVRVVFPTLDQIVPDSGWDPRQVVPTAGAYKGTTYHTAFLSEFWPADAPSVVSVAGDGAFATWTSVTTGRSYVTGLAVGPDGNLYLNQLSDTDLATSPMGSVHRVLADGTVEPVVEGLLMPHGIAFDGDGNLYVSIYVLMSGPGMPAGQVVRFDGIAAPA